MQLSRLSPALGEGYTAMETMNQECVKVVKKSRNRVSGRRLHFLSPRNQVPANRWRVSRKDTIYASTPARPFVNWLPFSLRKAQPLMAIMTVVQAMSSAVRPMTTVKMNMASRLYDSSAATVSLLLTMKVIPPEIRQNAVTISVGGRDGRNEVGGEMYRVM
jgi:hypothetical protein